MCVSVCAGTNPRWFVVCMSVWVYGLAFLSVALPWSGKALHRQIPQGVCPSECLVWPLTSGGIFQEMAAGPPMLGPHLALTVMLQLQC